MRSVARATVTPLASIFGSGLLVVVPVLASAVGPYSLVAMVAILCLAWGVSAVIRHNIIAVEPLLRNNPPRMVVLLDQASTYALIFAYVLSVCLDLHLVAAFVLRSFDADSAFAKALFVTVSVAIIALMGMVGGLRSLESLEKHALAITLAVVSLLLLSFAQYDIVAAASPTGLTLLGLPDRTPWEAARMVAGTLMVVQGFETTRYLGDSYDAPTRTRASSLSLLIAAAVYIPFVALAMPLLPTLAGSYDANSLFDLAMTASVLLPIPVVVAAAMSQLSAAVADSVAAVGSATELSCGRLRSTWAFAGVGLGAIALAWTGDTLTVVAWTSRAFALYYLLQCLIALAVCRHAGRRVWLLLVAVLLTFVTLFAEPAG